MNTLRGKMRYSLRSAMWLATVMCFAVALSINVYRSQITPVSYQRFNQVEFDQRAQLQALRRELDRCLGEGWTIGRGDDGKLYVRPYRPARLPSEEDRE